MRKTDRIVILLMLILFVSALFGDTTLESRKLYLDGLETDQSGQSISINEEIYETLINHKNDALICIYIDEQYLSKTSLKTLGDDLANLEALADRRKININSGFTMRIFFEGFDHSNGKAQFEIAGRVEIDNYLNHVSYEAHENPDLAEHVLNRFSELRTIRREIIEKGARWRADLNPIFMLRDHELERLTGLVEYDIDEPAEEPMPRLERPLDLPDNLDWRDRFGHDWMTSVKDQGSCGSCWAFASVAAVEAVINVVENDPTINLDLAEETLVSECCDDFHCGNCAAGGSRMGAFSFIRDIGIPTESCDTYTASDGPCDRCETWESEVRKIKGWDYLTQMVIDIDRIKTALHEQPLSTTFLVYQDFYAYSEGVYEYVIGDSVGSHSSVFAGWQDGNNCWIVKNSWGTDWGEDGYFRIVFNEVEIGTRTIKVFYDPLFVDAGEPVTIEYGDSVVLNPTISGGSPNYSFSPPEYSYLWSPSEGLSDSTARNPVAKPSRTITYTLSVTDLNGVVRTDDVEINATPTPVNPTIVNVFFGLDEDPQMTVQWSGGWGDSYSIYRSIDGSEYEFLASTEEISFIDTDVTMGSEYCYRVQACFDLDCAVGYSPSDCDLAHIFPYPYQCDFESGCEDDWYPKSITADNLWHLETYRHSSPDVSYAFNTGDPDYTYSVGTHVAGALYTPYIEMPEANLSLNFAHLIEKTTICIALLEITTDFGNTWELLQDFTESTPGWVIEDIEISSFAGDTARFRFVFSSELTGEHSLEGWYVDDFGLSGATLTPITVNIETDYEPYNLSFKVDGVDYVNSAEFEWISGSSKTIEYNGRILDKRFVQIDNAYEPYRYLGQFLHWDDGTDEYQRPSFSFTVPDVPTTITCHVKRIFAGPEAKLPHGEFFDIDGGKKPIATFSGDMPPIVTITLPETGDEFSSVDLITFQGIAEDIEDGIITGADMVWTSDIDGEIGTGGEFETSLTAGNHTITLTAEDSYGNTSTDVIDLIITPGHKPVVTIANPDDGESFSSDDLISFVGSADDVEDGAITGASLVWTSSKDGEIGTGTTFETDELSKGSHIIRLAAQDSDGNIGYNEITIFIDYEPFVIINNPIDGEQLIWGEDILFSGLGYDIEDGVLTGSSLVWTSDIDGEIGTGETFETASLSYGSHVITLTAEDSDGNTNSDEIIIWITNKPEATIDEPPSHSVFDPGYEITLEGSANDFEDGELTGASLVWTSNIDGELGTGNSLPVTLSGGSHIITLTATDSDGHTDTYEITVIVGIGCEACVDYDGNLYSTVSIGGKCWMAENLKTTHYANGTPIPHITDFGEWNDLTTGAYSESHRPVWFPDVEKNVEIYGRLYNWFAVNDARGICPDGWLPASDIDWQNVEVSLGMDETDANDTGLRGTNQGSALAGGEEYWYSGDLKEDPAFNTSGFNALPGGSREGSYDRYMRSHGEFWTSTEGYYPAYAFNRSILARYTGVMRYGTPKHWGFAVRCVKIIGALPVVEITSPVDEYETAECTPIILQGNATDDEDGILTEESLRWYSNIDGVLGSGEEIGPLTLSIGTHIIRLEATDSDDNTARDEISIIVTYCPDVEILSPPNYEVILYGEMAEFEGTAHDAEDGPLTGASLVWTSSIDGVIGEGEEVSTDELTVGSHVITLTATNSFGTTGTDEITIIIDEGFCPPTVTDYDGNVYNTVVIGDQCWMAENLRATTYRDGTAIPHVTDNGTWGGLSTGAYCEYDNDSANVAVYGRLYNFSAVNNASGICPTGWKVPSDDDFKELEIYLGMDPTAADLTGARGTNQGSQLAGGYDLWDDGNLRNNAAFGTSGFNWLPAGSRNPTNGTYQLIGARGYLWTDTTSGPSAWFRFIGHNETIIYRYAQSRSRGNSVRCLKIEAP